MDRSWKSTTLACAVPRFKSSGFLFCGHVKNIVYRSPIATEEQLRGRVQEAFATITPEMITNSKLSFLRLARLCLQMNGGHFEHLLCIYFSFHGPFWLM
jgi:hypothetical protein